MRDFLEREMVAESKKKKTGVHNEKRKTSHLIPANLHDREVTTKMTQWSFIVRRE
jgi:hypothetical protein